MKKLDSVFWKKYFRVYDVLNLVIPYQELLDEIILETNPKKGEVILDAGGGTGNLALKISELGAKIVVLDNSKEALEICRNKNDSIEIAYHDLRKDLPFPDNRFDKIVTNNTLYTIEKSFRDNLVKEFHRILKNGGILVSSNLLDHFKPLKIYIDHIQKSIQKKGLLFTGKQVLQMLVPTVQMFYYNLFIKRANKSGDYSFFTNNEQSMLFECNRFKSIRSKRVYSNQAILNVFVNK